MASSGNINSSTFNGRTYRISWSQSQNVSGNYSTITCKHYLINPPAYDLYIYGRDNSCTVGGDTKSYTSPAISTGGNSTIHLGTTTHTVYHNADGSKSVSISGTFNIQATLAGVWHSSVSASGTVTLDAIPRGARLTNNATFTDEGNPTITYSNPATTSVNLLQAGISFKTRSESDVINGVSDIAYRDLSKTGSSYTFNLTDAERNLLLSKCTTSNQLLVYVHLRSKIGSQWFCSIADAMMTVVNALPTADISLEAIDTHSLYLTQHTCTIIDGVTDLNWSITNAKAKKGATIKSYKAVNGKYVSTETSGTITDSASSNFAFTVTDSRGNYTTYQSNQPFVHYFRPTIKGDIGNPTTAGEMLYRVSGKWYNGKFGEATGAKSNELKCYYRYYENDEGFGADNEGWIEVPASDIKIEGDTYSISSKITGLNYRSKYSFQARTQDAIYNVMTKNVKTVSSIPVYDWSDVDFNFNVPVQASESITVPNAKYYKATDADGELHNVLGISGDNNLLIGHSLYSSGIGDSYLYGNDVGIRSNGEFNITSPAAGLTKRAYGVNKVLWSGGAYMHGEQTATLSEAITAQPHGIVLSWSWYNDSGAQDYSWVHVFVPKNHILMMDGAGTGVCCFALNTDANMVKYVYVHDTKIVGHSSNGSSGTTGGVAYNNQYYVLRYVTGV